MATDVNRVPTGNESVTDITSYGDSSQYLCVDDAVGSPDDATTYDYVHPNGERNASFSFATPSIPSGATINYVRVTMRVYGDASQNTFKALLKTNGTYYVGTSNTSTGVWTTFTQDWTTNPNTSAAWTVDDVNGSGSHPLQAMGVRMAGYDTGKLVYDAKCTQVYLTVNYTAAIGGGVFSAAGSATALASGAFSVVERS